MACTEPIQGRFLNLKRLKFDGAGDFSGFLHDMEKCMDDCNVKTAHRRRQYFGERMEGSAREVMRTIEKRHGQISYGSLIKRLLRYYKPSGNCLLRIQEFQANTSQKDEESAKDYGTRVQTAWGRSFTSREQQNNQASLGQIFLSGLKPQISAHLLGTPGEPSFERARYMAEEAERKVKAWMRQFRPGDEPFPPPMKKGDLIDPFSTLTRTKTGGKKLTSFAAEAKALDEMP